MDKKLSDSIIINRPAEYIWNVITDTENLHNFGFGSAYSQIGRDSARVGTTFDANSNGSGRSSPRYITQWSPPHHFGFGSTPNSTTESFKLTELGDKTEVRFSRIYDFNIFEVLGLFDTEKYRRSIRDNTLTKLKNFCEKSE